jgi:hypothetical protein
MIDHELAEGRGHEFLSYADCFFAHEIAEFFQTTPGTVAAGILYARKELGLEALRQRQECVRSRNGAD